jgi:hypothetical protein
MTKIVLHEMSRFRFAPLDMTEQLEEKRERKRGSFASALPFPPTKNVLPSCRVERSGIETSAFNPVKVELNNVKHEQNGKCNNRKQSNY